ncbi:MAG: hypothetical protein PHD32_08810, partial [Eubacteriales bacterium]|nr:hypothetical protein [Eubacteriales bacterium]
EMAVFAQFSSELDKPTQTLLAQGERLTEMLKQPQYSPMPVEEQVALLHVVIHRMLLELPVNRMTEFKAGFLEHMRTQYADTLREIGRSGVLSDDNAQTIEKAAKEHLTQMMPPEDAAQEAEKEQA